MPQDRHDAEIGLLLSAFVVFIAVLLAYRQWTDRRAATSISGGTKQLTIPGKTSAAGWVCSSW